MTEPTEETQAEFEARYNAVSQVDQFERHKISMPCTCEDGGGPTHWAAVTNTPEMIALHIEDEELRGNPLEAKKGG